MGLRVVSLVPHYGDPVVWLIGAFVAIILIWALAESRQRLSFTRYAVGLSSNVRAAAIAGVPGRAANGSAPGDLISTVTGDTARVKTGVKSIPIGISRNGAFFLGVAVIGPSSIPWSGWSSSPAVWPPWSPVRGGPPGPRGSSDVHANVRAP